MTRLHDGTIFWGGCDTLKGVPGAIQKKLHFSAHLRCLKGYLGFTHLTKNQSIGVAWGVLHTLMWIFEYVTDWPFAKP